MAESFEELGLSEEVMGALKEMSIEAPTEIQCIGIPAVMDRKSVVLGSHTGSGKTLAYLLPIVQLMREDEATLESQVDEKAREVKGKDELVAEEEKLLKEKEDKIVSLQTEVSSLQGSSDSAKQLGKVQARVVELEKQVEVLGTSWSKRTRRKLPQKLGLKRLRKN
ncbi:DEAD-box ATP-dependent RNA helicase 47A [Brassica napus]|uniref:DEAD-box ATP-dependent RNA helicase 47A-like n=1 Tax=Brassica oleracea var. oleracea TaxID=109376 RepID=UPI0006A6A873|nr:PREDICTED: DEAD-box ATP-dependent RNA helicase 47A-like [Brassica oleracea var. oleracea]XP_013713042.1 DEAD-box ATP-dependent RNA helicase 47A [Brassica napus]